MVSQYLFKITDFLKAPMTIGVVLVSATVVAVVHQWDFLKEIATKKKENKNLKEEEAANSKENAE
ncbi:PREDICTED: uncharacterized protein LOC104790168 [Camelina sativa]|uniref:Uncharacterized protein LOC104790168 n=1 Tax=Camelina sativa TaxID=90675 RepID=A0ABM0ZDC2_CAMSA|nr:PREDICTED: uncharacterized protein LOC104790168 [Camelina sativa]